MKIDYPFRYPYAPRATPLLLRAPNNREHFGSGGVADGHAELAARGVNGYDRRALDDDYRLSVLWQIATPVWQAANNIPPWIWWNNLGRTFLAVDDLGCRELLV